MTAVHDNFVQIFPHMDIHQRKKIDIKTVISKCNELHGEGKGFELFLM